MNNLQWYKKWQLVATIWSTCNSASLGLFSCTVSAISWRESVKYVCVSRWIFRLYMDDTAWFTNPRLLSWKSKQNIINKWNETKSEKKTTKLLGDKSYVENLGAQEKESITPICG